MQTLAKSEAFWWTLLVIAALVVVAMVSMILLANVGNWFTVIGSCCTIAVCVGMLRSLRRQRR